MKIECIKDKIQEALVKIDRVTNKNATLPILSCVLFIAKNNSLTLKATNLDVGIEITLPVKVFKEGVLAVFSQTISSVISNIKANKITLEEKGGFLSISSENSSLQLKTTPVEDFPLIPRPENGGSYSINAKELVFGIKSVIFCASPSSIKPELGSVFINHKDGHLIFAATDSFRLAEKKIPLKSAETIPNILIPFKNAAELIRIFEGSDEKLSLSLSKNQMGVSSTSVYFSSRVVDGVFPDYEQIVPKEFVSTANALKQEVVDAIKTTASIVDKYNQAVFSLDVKKQTLLVSAQNSEVGESSISVKSKASGEDVSMSFNQKYIADAAVPIADDSLTLKFGGLHKPLLIEGTSNKTFRYIVMPMNR